MKTLLNNNGYQLSFIMHCSVLLTLFTRRNLNGETYSNNPLAIDDFNILNAIAKITPKEFGKVTLYLLTHIDLCI